jgi:hypothetical protein
VLRAVGRQLPRNDMTFLSIGRLGATAEAGRRTMPAYKEIVANALSRSKPLLVCL